MSEKPLSQLKILIKGAGEMATGIACRLHQANLRRIVMAETRQPLAVRRTVSFCEVVHDDHITVEGITAINTTDADSIRSAWEQESVAVIVDPEWQIGQQIQFDVVVDAIIAKKNLGTNQNEAPLVIGMGPGFNAGSDVHKVIETNRGHNMGRVISNGPAEANTGIPGNIGGHTALRVLRAPCDGPFHTDCTIGDLVKAGDAVGRVNGETVTADLDGVVRGLIRPGSTVRKGLKIGDIDPRGDNNYCFTVSDKARSLGGAVLEAILETFNV